MCRLCELNNGTGGFILTICDTCKVLLVVLREHRAEFTEEERQRIHSLFPGSKIRWEQRQIQDHAHCHILS